jgi:hypothetical protein
VARALVMALALLACAAPPRTVMSPIAIHGRAADAKGGAVLVADDGSTIYIAGLDSWPPELAGRRVVASGRLVQRKMIPDPVVSDAGEHSAGAYGEQTILEQASWKAER